MRRRTAAASFALSLMLPIPVFAQAGDPAQLDPTHVTVTTVAGSGLVADVDGPAQSAAFVMPAGIAVGPDGSIYVTDIGAQAIRRISASAVTTIAGVGNPSAHPDQLRGGYVDGPARLAQFSRPEGIAVGRDGTVYVADTLNHCIRIIRNGIVSTLAGSATAGSSDGTGTAAHFGLPKGIALDDDGNVYVADAAIGVRKITPHGTVTTLDLPMASDKLLTSISVRGAGPTLQIAYSDTRSVYLVKGSDRKVAAFDAKNQPWGEAQIFGYSFGVAIVGSDAVAVTDLSSESVKYIRFDEPPYFPGAISKTFAAGRVPGTWAVGGFADGRADAAKFNAPFGIALDRDGSLLVSDSGNRRIRRLSAIDARAFVKPDLSDLTFRRDAYRVMMVGDSNMFSNVTWDESIPGIVESGLRRDAAATGLTRNPDVEFVSISGLGLHPAESFIDNFFADGEADLVILVVDDYFLLNDPALEPNGTWRAAAPPALRALEQKLRAGKTQFALLVLPPGESVSPAEHLRSVEMQIDPARYDFDLSYAETENFEDVFCKSAVHCIGLLAPMHDVEEGPERGVFFNSDEHHMTPEGVAWAARYALNDIEKWAPWKR